MSRNKIKQKNKKKKFQIVTSGFPITSTQQVARTIFEGKKKNVNLIRFTRVKKSNQIKKKIEIEIKYEIK